MEKRDVIPSKRNLTRAEARDLVRAVVRAAVRAVVWARAQNVGWIRVRALRILDRALVRDLAMEDRQQKIEIEQIECELFDEMARLRLTPSGDSSPTHHRDSVLSFWTLGRHGNNGLMNTFMFIPVTSIDVAKRAA